MAFSLPNSLGEATRNGHLWLPGYMKSLRQVSSRKPPKRVWLSFMDHYEPMWRQPGDPIARGRVAVWRQKWPEIAERHRDSRGRKPVYSFFYPQEEYAPQYLDPLAEMAQMGIGEVEIHIHHDNDTEAGFIDKMSGFLDVLSNRHGLMHKIDGRVVFGFIHGNWCLDNSRPDGRYCGINNEILLLKQLGCYADFTFPSAPSPTQPRTVNTIYWATDDAAKPKSHEYGVAVTPNGGVEGDLLMIPGPLALRWGNGRLLPRMETGEMASQDPPTPERVKLWFDYAPRLGDDLFIKLFTHGAQEKNSGALLNGDLDKLMTMVRAACDAAGAQLCFASAFDMWRAVDSIRRTGTSDEALSPLQSGSGE